MSSTENSHIDSDEQGLERALTHTLTDEFIGDENLNKLLETIDSETLAESQQSNALEQALLDTLYDSDLSDKHVDFYTNDITAAAKEDDDEFSDFDDALNEDTANERLQDNAVPGRYEIISLLGSGASGHVYSVKDNNLERTIGVKFMHPKHITKLDKIKHFINEARATANLTHPNITAVHDIDYTDGAIPFFSMRQVNGDTLQNLIKKNDPRISTYAQVVSIGLHICETIAYAHSKQFIHNDIKPGNIMIGELGEVTVLDWGTSTNRNEPDPNSRILGTPMYMSPEQARKETSDELSDIYCIGSTLFHTITKRYPLNANNYKEFWELKRSGYYSQATPEEARTIPAPLLAILYKSLNAKRQNRYQSVIALKNDLLAFQSGESISAYKDSLWQHCKRIYLKNKRNINLGIISCITIALILTLIHFERQKQFSQWNLVHSNNFENYSQTRLNNEWHSTNFPQWNIKNKVQSNNALTKDWIINQGSLQSDTNNNPFNGIRNLTSSLNFSGSLKVSWDIHSNNEPRDFNAFIGGTHRFNAYTFHIGGFGNPQKVELSKSNSVNQIDVGFLDEPLAKNRVYHICMEKEQSIVRLYINDKLIINYRDPIPLVGPKHQSFGFEHNGNSYSIDNVKVWHKPLPQKTNPFTKPDDFFSHGRTDLAITSYQDLLDTHPKNSDTYCEALFKLAQCHLNEGKLNKANIGFKTFSSNYSTHTLHLHALMNLCDIALKRNDLEQAQKILKQIGTTYHGNNNARWILSRTCEYLEDKNIQSLAPHHPHSVKTAIDLINEILSIENQLGLKSQRFLGYTLDNCALTLQKTGQYKKLFELCPDTHTAAILQTQIYETHSLPKPLFLTREYLQALIRHEHYSTAIQTYADKPRFFHTIYCNKTDADALLKHAQTQTDLYKTLLALSKTENWHQDYIHQPLTELLDNQQHSAAINLLNPYTSFHHQQLKKHLDILLNQTTAQASDTHLHLDALCLDVLRHAQQKHTTEAQHSLDRLKSYRNNYRLPLFEGLLISPITNLIIYNDKDKFIQQLQEEKLALSDLYANSHSTCIDFLCNNASLVDILAIPHLKAQPNMITLLRALHAELHQPQEAIQYYKQFTFQTASSYTFSRQRIKTLRERDND